MGERTRRIKQKGFYMPLADKTQNIPTTDFSKLRIGIQTLQDAVFEYGSYARANSSLGNKDYVLKAINDYNLDKMRQISEFYYRSDGIYQRLCRYMAFLYKYDWFVTPYIGQCEGLLDNSAGMSDMGLGEDPKVLKERKKIFSNFFEMLWFLDDFDVKRFFNEVALEVIKVGCYYGYLIRNGKKVYVQKLLPSFCRSRFKINNHPVVEFNMKFFEVMYQDEELRKRVIASYPEDFQKGYRLYLSGKLKNGRENGWYILDWKNCIKFNFNDGDYPPFLSVIPYIIDLDAAQELDQAKMKQKLLKIIIQKMPIDKNGDLVFDVDEAQMLHNNAVNMLRRAIGIDVLTTFADVDVADMSDKGNQSNVDELEKVERTVYNEAGVSQMQFNSDSNTALNNSILNDEASLSTLIKQFESFLNLLIDPYNKNPKKAYYRAQILNTTIYNYKQMSKLYKEQMQVGYSKMLAQVALGQSQSSVLANAYFENDILDLVRVFIPPLMSSTMNAEALQNRGSTGGSNATTTPDKQTPQENGEQGGRPEKPDNEKSDKTLANRQSL